MKKVAIDKATVKQLREFAMSTCGIDIPPSSNRLTVLAQLQQVWDKPEIEVAEEDPDAARKVALAKLDKDLEPAPEKPRKVTVHIHITEGPGGTDRVPLSVNGRAMLVDRGIDSEIPEHFFLVLQNAVEKRYDPLPDGKGFNPIPRLVPLYPYSVIRAAH